MSTRRRREVSRASTAARRVVCPRGEGSRYRSARVLLRASERARHVRGGALVGVCLARVGATRSRRAAVVLRRGRVRVRWCVVKRPFGSQSHRVGAMLRRWVTDTHEWQRAGIDAQRRDGDVARLVMFALRITHESPDFWDEWDVAFCFCADIDDVSERRHSPRAQAEMQRLDDQWRDATRDPSWCSELHRAWEWRRP